MAGQLSKGAVRNAAIRFWPTITIGEQCNAKRWIARRRFFSFINGLVYTLSEVES